MQGFFIFASNRVGREGGPGGSTDMAALRSLPELSRITRDIAMSHLTLLEH
jgi:hypothetical protein